MRPCNISFLWMTSAQAWKVSFRQTYVRLTQESTPSIAYCYIWKLMANWKRTVVRWLWIFVVVQQFVVKAEQVDGDRVSAGVVLLDGREERLSEVKPRQPEHARRSVLKPVLTHHYIIITINTVVSWQRGERGGGPARTSRCHEHRWRSADPIRGRGGENSPSPKF